MNKGTVFLGFVVAAGLGYASAEFLDAGPPTEQVRIRGGFRRGAESIARLPADAPVDPATVNPGTVKPGAPAPKPGPDVSKPAPAPEPAKVPAPPPVAVRTRVVKDVKLAFATNAKDYALKSPREVHVDLENSMTWYGDDGKTMAYKDLKHLGTDLRGKTGPQLVIVAATEVPWQQICLMIEQAQNNYAPAVHLGVARKEEPETLRVLPIPQCERSDEPLPEGKTFRMLLESKSGEPVISLDGRKLAAFPADLAAAWNEWKKANSDLADTTTPEKTRVILEAPRGASVEHVIRVIDVLRGLGIQSERYVVAAPMRKLK
jgi:biopolymer transport protein ExbD